MSDYTQTSIVQNKFLFEQMIKSTKDLHNSLFGIENTKTLNIILKDLYINHKNSIIGSYEKQHYSDTINEMCDYVLMKCNVTKTKIYETWLKVVFEGAIVLAPLDNQIISYIKEFIFGRVQTYQIIFEHNDRKTGKGRYYYVIKIELDATDKIKMFVSIQDLSDDYYSSVEKGLSMITNSSLCDDGFIAFDVSNETLLDLAHYAYHEFNNFGFSGGFEVYPHISLTNNNKMREYVNSYIAISQFNTKFMDLLIPF